MTTSETLNPGMTPTAEARARELYAEHDAAVTQRTDRMFAALLGAQWLVAIVLSLAVSPYAWQGSQRSMHLHVWAAVLLGGLLSAPPIAMVLLFDPEGALRFRGGVTSGRGHEGNNDGAAALESALRGRPGARAWARVFGCGLAEQ